MRWPRLRLTIRRLMIAVALIGVCLFGTIELDRLSKLRTRYQMREQAHAQGEKSAGDDRAMAAHHAEMRRRYERAAVRPWEPLHLGWEVVPGEPGEEGLPDWPLRENLAGLLMRAEPDPSGRSARFRWVRDQLCPEIYWHGYIRQVTPTRDGWVVDVRVSPMVDNSSSTAILDYYSETFEVSRDGAVRFLGSRDIPGLGPGWGPGSYMIL